MSPLPASCRRSGHLPGWESYYQARATRTDKSPAIAAALLTSLQSAGKCPQAARARKRTANGPVDGKRLPAPRRLLHPALQLERDGAITQALDVIARHTAPALGRRFDCRPQKGSRLGHETRLRKLDVFVRAISVKRFPAILHFEVDGAIRPRLRGRGVDHAPGILRCPSHKRVAVARQERAHIHQRSNFFGAILGSLRNGDAAHAVARQNHRPGLCGGDFANSVGVAEASHSQAASDRLRARANPARALCPFASSSGTTWAGPPAVPRAVNQQISRHDRAEF